MIGKVVTHTRYGRGVVTSFQPPRIEIAFDDGTVKTFAYPGSVARFIRFEDEDAQHRAARDLAREEVLSDRVAEQIREGRRRAEADALQLRDAQREKRIATAKRTAARAAAARATMAGNRE